MGELRMKKNLKKTKTEMSYSLLIRYLIRINFTVLLTIVGVTAIIFFGLLINSNSLALQIMSEGIKANQQRSIIYGLLIFVLVLNTAYTLSFLRLRKNYKSKTSQNTDIPVNSYEINIFSAFKVFDKDKIRKDFEHDHSSREAGVVLISANDGL